MYQLKLQFSAPAKDSYLLCKLILVLFFKENLRYIDFSSTRDSIHIIGVPKQEKNMEEWKYLKYMTANFLVLKNYERFQNEKHA